MDRKYIKLIIVVAMLITMIVATYLVFFIGRDDVVTNGIVIGKINKVSYTNNDLMVTIFPDDIGSAYQLPRNEYKLVSIIEDASNSQKTVKISYKRNSGIELPTITDVEII